MKIALSVNDIEGEFVDYTTTLLALTAVQHGHDVWYIPVGDFTYDPDGRVHARARRAPKREFASPQDYLENIKSDEALRERITVADLDILMLRNDPSADVFNRPWARLAGINFGRLAARNGVIVLNDPDGLNRAANKLYLQQFPKSVWPDILITRDKEEIRGFIHDQGGRAVLKPLSGSGGRNVFLIQSKEAANLNQMIEAVLRDGFVIAQEYLPGAVDGDTRLFMMNGKVLTQDGRVAAVHRVRAKGDMRSNLTAGGHAIAADITDAMHQIAETVAPMLIEDGIFFAGLDIVGDKLMEINVFSPGGLIGASHLQETNFAVSIIEALERKVVLKRDSTSPMTNAQIAMRE